MSINDMFTLVPFNPDSTNPDSPNSSREHQSTENKILSIALLIFAAILGFLIGRNFFPRKIKEIKIVSPSSSPSENPIRRNPVLKALEAFEKGALLGNTQCWHSLKQMENKYDSIDSDRIKESYLKIQREKITQLEKQVAQNSSHKDCYLLGCLYEEVDEQELALKTYKIGARAGNSLCLTVLKKYHLFDLDQIQESYSASKKNEIMELEKRIALEKNPLDNYLLGCLFLEIDEIEQAIEVYKAGASQGDACSFNALEKMKEHQISAVDFMWIELEYCKKKGEEIEKLEKRCSPDSPFNFYRLGYLNEEISMLSPALKAYTQGARLGESSCWNSLKRLAKSCPIDLESIGEDYHRFKDQKITELHQKLAKGSDPADYYHLGTLYESLIED